MHYDKDDYSKENPFDKETCTSCDIEFLAQDNNDRAEGWFCDSCLVVEDMV